MIEIKVADTPDQRFGLTLNNRRVTMRLRYNTLIDRWSFDLAVDDVPVLTGRRVIIGVNLLAAFPQLADLGVIFAADIVEGSQPGRYDLPNGKVRLYQTTEAEIANAILA